MYFWTCLVQAQSGRTGRGSKGSAPTDESSSLSVLFSPHSQNILFLVFPREVLIMDLTVNQAVGELVLERGGSPFESISSCSRQNLVYCLHRNGCITARVCVQGPSMEYVLVAQSEALRLGKGARVQAMAVHALDETRVVTLASNGRVLVYRYGPADPSPAAALPAVQLPTETLGAGGFAFVLSTLIESVPSSVLCMKVCPVSAASAAVDPVVVDPSGPGEAVVAGNGGSAAAGGGGKQLSASALDPPAASAVTSTAAGVALGTGQRAIAVGTAAGYLQIFDSGTCMLERQFFIHSSGCRQLDWAGADRIVCIASEDSGTAAAACKNLVVEVNVKSGRIVTLYDRYDDPCAVINVRTSHLCQYLLIIFNESPLELWDLNAHTLLKTMPSTFPMVTAVEWSLMYKQNMSGLISKPTAGAGAVLDSSGSGEKHPYIKEHFVVTTADGSIFHFTVEGSNVRHGAPIPADHVPATVNCLAWKGDWIVTGDSAGMLHFWDFKKKVSRSVVTSHAGVVDVVFAPHQRSRRFLALFTDGVGIWDAADSEPITVRKFPPKAKDSGIGAVAVCWVHNERPALAMSDGSIHIYDARLKTSQSPVLNYSHVEPPQCLNVGDPKVIQYTQSVMQHQPFDKSYADLVLPVPALSAPPVFERSVQQMLASVPSHFREALLETKRTAGRCLLTAQLFGDEYELRFWTIFSHYLRANATENKGNGVLPWMAAINTAAPTGAAASRVVDAKIPRILKSPRRPNKGREHPLLPPSFGIHCDADTIQEQELTRLSMFKSKAKTVAEMRQSTQHHVLLGQNEEALQMLLETDAREPSFYVDSLRACIIATVSSPSTAQNTVKMVCLEISLAFPRALLVYG